MKHLKTFERYTTNTWSVGDYIVLNLRKIKEDYIKNYDKNTNKRNIPDIAIGKITRIFKFEENYPIEVTFHNNTKTRIEENEIKTMASIREKEYYKNQTKIFNTMNKYNL